MTAIYIAIFACVALLAVCALLLCNILERANELSEYGMRIAYGLTTVARQQNENADEIREEISDCAEVIISLSERLCLSPDKLDGEDSENPADENPDNPDSMSEADKLAERRFSDGVLNILGYCGMPNEEAKH